MLTTWCIYRDPTDFPRKFVVRAWHTLPGRPNPVAAERCSVVDTLAEARACIPEGLARLASIAGDVPHLVETWL